MPKAKSFCPAHFKETDHPNKGIGFHKTNEAWIEQQIFAIDIDKGLPLKEALKICEDYRLPLAFAYTSFSDTDGDRYRLVFILNHPVTEIRIHTLVMDVLQQIFPQMDKQCKLPSQFFFGGKKLVYENYEGRLDIVGLIEAACRKITLSDRSNASKKIKAFCQALGIQTKNGFPRFDQLEESFSAPTKFQYVGVGGEKDEDTKSQQYLYSIYSNGGEFVSSYRLYLSTSVSGKKSRKTKDFKYEIQNIEIKRDKVRNLDFHDITKKCRLYREFIDAQIWLDHNKLFALATNLLVIEGGKTKFLDGLSKRIEYASAEGKYKKQEFENYHINYINKTCYEPTQCDKYCPYANSCLHQVNIPETVRLLKNQVKIIHHEEIIPLIEAERRLEEVFESAMTSDDEMVHIIKADTGLGKTELYVKSKSFQNGILAVPTHALKNEIVKRIRKEGRNMSR